MVVVKTDHFKKKLLTNKSTRTENASALNLNSSVVREQFVAAGYHEPLARRN
jgi:hypothetical protein